MPAPDLGAGVAVLQRSPRVLSAWHFGSTAVGRGRVDSDIDLGILLDRRFTLEELLELSGALQDALRTDHVDLVVLNDVSPILRFEALSGRNLVCKDPERQAAFASLTAREYEDEMAMLSRFWPRRS